ncbi:MAG: carbohydrate ABC transporter permease [Phycisphaerae bacterium]
MNQRISRREQLAGMAFAAPYLIGMGAFLFFPLAMSLYYSFCNYSMLQPPLWIGWNNYRHLLTDQTFHTALLNTIIYAAISVPCTLTLSLLLAIFLNMPIRGQALYRTIVFLPSLVPLVAAALIWQWMFNADKGLINAALRPVLHLLGQDILVPLAAVAGAGHATLQALRNISPPVWLGNPHWAMAAIIFISFWGVGQTVIIFLAGLQNVPRELHEAAAIDGAGAIRRFFNITLPMLSPVIFFNLIMGIIGSWQVFDIPYVMTNGGPGRSTLFYSMYIFEAAFNELRMGPACAMAWIQLLIILILTALAFASARKWVYYA